MLIPLKRGADPLSRQVYLWIRHGIMERMLRPGESLPSTRELAEENSISRTVVVQAYDQLIAEGFITGRRGSGTYVSEQLNSAASPLPNRTAPLRLSEFGKAATAIVRRGLSPIQERSPLRYDFAYGTSSLEEFPLAAWRRILLRRTRRAPLRSFDYGAAMGDTALREAITGHLQRSRAIHCDVSQVLIVNGSQQALDLTIRLLLNPGDLVAVEDPQYHGMRQVLMAGRLRVRPVPVDQNGIDLSLDVVLRNFSKSLDGQSVTVPINSKILAIYESELLKFGNECQMLWCIGRRLMQAADPIHTAGFLRVAGQRPCHCRTTKKTDERPPLHSISSSARASSVGGMVRPSALAVVRLIAVTYLVGACTGRSAAFSPLRMRST